jgi:hypothetical protein
MGVKAAAEAQRADLMNQVAKDTAAPAPLQSPDSPANPAKPQDAPLTAPPEIPKVGTEDAPGG